MPPRNEHTASSLRCSYYPACMRVFADIGQRSKHETRKHLLRNTSRHKHFNHVMQPADSVPYRRLEHTASDRYTQERVIRFLRDQSTTFDDEPSLVSTDVDGPSSKVQSGVQACTEPIIFGLSQDDILDGGCELPYTTDASGDQDTSVPTTIIAGNEDITDAGPSSGNMSRLTLPSRGMISTATEITTTTFSEVTGREAGIVVDGEHLSDFDSVDLYDKIMENPIYPFTSNGERSLCFWFFQSDLTAGDIDRLLRIPDLTLNDRQSGKPIDLKSSFKYRDCLDQIDIGLTDGQSDWWRTTWTQTGNDGKPQTYYFLQRRLESVIRFLLGHRPFELDMAYAPIRNNTENGRIYTDMHTCDWWWDMQEKLPHGATVVPLILSSDKTLLTQSHGDKSAWPVYITIGNIAGHVRRKPRVPSRVLLGLIPVTKNISSRTIVFHEAMRRMLATLAELTKTGFAVRCADRRIRMCFPILAAYSVDYEESCIITGIKSQQHCPVCHVPPDEKEKLLSQWPFRTHESMAELKRRQAVEGIPKTHPDWVHSEVKGFHEGLPLVNIHTTIVPDLLHQVYKGVLKHMLEWSYALLKQSNIKCPALGLNDSRSHAQRAIDRRFATVPSFYNLRKFPDYSNVKQWSGSNYRDISRIMVPVFAPLFREIRADDATQCLRALADFIRLAEYRSHDPKTLQYMDHALYRLDKHVEVFRSVRGKNDNEGHFNFPKWHSLSHYTWFIRQYGALTDLCTSHSERAHIETIKRPYLRTNKHFDFETQLIRDNTRRMKMLTLESVRNYISLRNEQQEPKSWKDETVKLTYASNIIPMRQFNWGTGHFNEIQSYITRLDMYRINDHLRWRSCHQVAEWSGIPELPCLVAKFVENRRFEMDARRLEEQDRLEGIASLEAKAAWRETLIDRSEYDGDIDLADIRSRFPQIPPVAHIPTHTTVDPRELIVGVHPSIHAFKQLGKEGHDLGKEDGEIIRCSPRWQGQGGAEARGRYDCVWFNETREGLQSATNDILGGQGVSGLDGLEVGQLRLIFTVLEPDRQRTSGLSSWQRYCGAIIDVFKPRKGIDSVTGTVILDRQKLSVGRRAVDLPCIIRSAHLVPVGDVKESAFYINNHADFQQFNTIFDDDFLSDGIRVAEAAKKKLLLARKMSEKVRSSTVGRGGARKRRYSVAMRR